MVVYERVYVGSSRACSTPSIRRRATVWSDNVGAPINAPGEGAEGLLAGFGATADLLVVAASDELIACERRIHFAGDHTSRWPGFMQGALESARRAVDENEAVLCRNAIGRNGRDLSPLRAGGRAFFNRRRQDSARYDARP